jgi:glyoxylase-like metal-dependent hydrolase (beta-lactamase superfamily II)
MAEPGNIIITGHAQKAAWDNKTFPAVERIADGVWSIPVPFPDNPLRYTLSYLLTGPEGAVVVDPGWDSDEGWEHLLAGLAAAGITAQQVTGIAVTHYHPDHHGMTARLQRASGARLAMGQDERWRSLPADPLGAAAADRGQLTFWGVPADRLEEMAMSGHRISVVPTLPVPDLRLGDGELLPLAGRSIRVIATPGHTPGHICLLDEDNSLLFSGDHVLPRISPHISLERGGLENPLAVYFESLAALAGCFPDDGAGHEGRDDGDGGDGGTDDGAGVTVEVCPAHEYRFSGIRNRIAILEAHNRARSEEVAAVLESSRPDTVWEVAKELTWSRGWDALHGYSLRFAIAETASHLVYLRSRGWQIGIETGWLDPERGAATEPALARNR